MAFSFDRRQKIYYSKDQIVNNLFTNGREFMTLREFKEYTGFYHRYTTGEVFTENEWNPRKSERLIRWKQLSEPVKKYYDLKLFTKSKDTNRPYLKLKDSNYSQEYYNYISPKPVRRKLTNKEIDAGNTYRYFITKRNERDRVFFEVSVDQGLNYGDYYTGINQYLYELLIIPWKVDGPEYDVYDKQSNFLKIAGVIDTNLRIIDKFSVKNPLLRQVLKNPRELTVYDIRR